MKVSSLWQIALESVADYIENGYYDKIDYLLDPQISHEIFTLISKNGPISKNLLEHIGAKFTLARVDLENQPIEIVQNRTLESFKLGEPNMELINLLSKASRENLKHLEFRTKEQYSSKWIKSVTRALPKIETLIVGRIHQAQFSLICQNFDCLRNLDIDFFFVLDLNGIGNLKNLEVLCVRDAFSLNHPTAIMPIFECTKLRMLDVSRSADYSTYECNVIENYLKCGKVLPELRFLDCKWTDIDKDKLEALMRTHKNLKQVVALNTILERSLFPGIELLNRATPQSFIKCLQHYLFIRKDDYVQLLIGELRSTIFQYLNETEDKENVLLNFLRLVCHAMKIFHSHMDIFWNGVIGLHSIVRLLAPTSLKTDDLNLLVDQLITSGTRWMTMESIRNTFITFWSIFTFLPLHTLPSHITRKLASFLVKYRKARNGHMVLWIHRLLLNELKPENLISMWPRSDVWEPLILWIGQPSRDPWNLEYYNRVEKVLEMCSTVKRGQEIVEKLASEDIRARIVVFLNSGGLTKEIIGSIRKAISKKDQKTCFASLANYIISKMPKFLDNLDSKTFYAMEFLSTIIATRYEEIYKKVDIELQALCVKVQKTALKFSDFPAIQILKNTLRNLGFDGPKMWALLMIKLMLEKDKNLTLFKLGLYSEVEAVKSCNSETMKLKVRVMNCGAPRWKY